MFGLNSSMLAPLLFLFGVGVLILMGIIGAKLNVTAGPAAVGAAI